MEKPWNEYFLGNDSQKEPEVPDERHYPASGAGLAGHPKNRNFAGPDPESAGPLVRNLSFNGIFYPSGQ